LWALVRLGVVERVSYKACGCTASIAAGSVLTVRMLGQPIEVCGKLQAADIDSELGGLPPESRHAALLAIDALRTWLAMVNSGKIRPA